MWTDADQRLLDAVSDGDTEALWTVVRETQRRRDEDLLFFAVAAYLRSRYTREDQGANEAFERVFWRLVLPVLELLEQAENPDVELSWLIQEIRRKYWRKKLPFEVQSRRLMQRFGAASAALRRQMFLLKHPAYLLDLIGKAAHDEEKPRQKPDAL